jgi:pimeloyl-ACP methyl ester carboxylesterase
MLYVPFLLALLLLFAPGDDPGTVLESEFVATYPAANIAGVIEQFYPPEQVRPARYSVDEYRVRLVSSNAEGEPIEIVAQLYVPSIEAETPLPVFVMGAGSTGLDDRCAPSNERPEVQNWGSYRAFLLTMATQGYITILPDYAGFNDPDTIQPYYVAEMAGRVLLDAGRAVYSFFAEDAEWVTVETGVTPSDTVLLVGYSQGGQSVFAAKDLWETYAPDLPVEGVVAYASVTNMQNHMLTLPMAAPFRLYAYRDYYGEDRVNLDEVFTDHWLPTLEDDVLRMCLMDGVSYYSANPQEMYRPEFYEALVNATLDEDYPELYKLFELNNPGFVPNDIPALIVQATGDFSLPMDVHERFVERYCAAGNHLTELINERVNHLRARQESYGEVLDWMQTIVDGETPPDVCSSN